MSSRTHSWNAFETELTSGVDDIATTIAVTSSLGLVAPCYLVIDPEDPGKREYIKVTGINGSVLTITRGEEGSAAGAGLGINHTAGAKVRAVAVHQWLDDIFDDIEALENAVPNHEASGDPHPNYLLESVALTTYLRLDSGNTPQADIGWGGFKITGLGDGAAASQDAATMNQLEAGDLQALTDANDYTDIEVAATLVSANAYTDAQVALYLPLAGGAMLGSIDLGGFALNGVGAIVGSDGSALTLTPGTNRGLFLYDHNGTLRININNVGDLAINKGSGPNVILWDESQDRIRIFELVNMEGNQIVNVADPTAGQHAATKAYVDAAIAAL